MSHDVENKSDGHPSNSVLREERENLRRQVLTSLAVCGLYIFVSSMMVFVNKSLTYTYGFNSTNTLLLIQMVFTAAFLRIARSVSLVSFEAFTASKAMRVLPVSIFYCLNGAAALVALRDMSVPSYTLVKRMAPLFTISMEYFLLRKRASGGVLASVLCMMVGAIVASRVDTSSKVSGWVLGFLSCFFQALYLAFVKKSGAESGLNTFGVLFYHSILSVPCLLVLVTAVGEWRQVQQFKLWTDFGFVLNFSASLFAGFLLNYALFLCTEKTSPTSTVVSGHVKALAQTVIGFFTFGGADGSPIYLLGTGINICGGSGYVYSKYKLLKQQAAVKG